MVCVILTQCTWEPSRNNVENTVSKVEPPVSEELLYESKERSDLLDDNSPQGLNLIQITSNITEDSWNVYTEAHVFTPDSKRFIFVREHNYWICDIDKNFALRQVTDEKGAVGPSVSPDGKWMYYLVDRTLTSEGTLTLKRLSLSNYTRETLLIIDATIPGTNYKPTQVYTLTSISQDGKKLVTSCFLGDGTIENAPWGLLVFDLENSSVSLVFEGNDFCNMHSQYCLSTDPKFSHDVLMQQNHGCVVDVNGNIITLSSGLGADLHVIKDDGTNWRDIPIGRNGVEYVQGHEQWRGRTNSVLSGMTMDSGKKRILIGYPIATDETTSHAGFGIADGKFIDITRNIENPNFWHFSSDLSGMNIISDTYPDDTTGKRIINLMIGTLSPGDNPELKQQYLLNTGTSASGDGESTHPHPFFSPDNTMVFFNSDVNGKPEVWMVTGFDFPEF